MQIYQEKKLILWKNSEGVIKQQNTNKEAKEEEQWGVQLQNVMRIRNWQIVTNDRNILLKYNLF